MGRTVAEPCHVHDAAPAFGVGPLAHAHLVEVEQRKAEVAEQSELGGVRVPGVHADAAIASRMFEFHGERTHKRLDLVVDVDAQLHVDDPVLLAERRQPRVLTANEDPLADLLQRRRDLRILGDIADFSDAQRLQQRARLRVHLAQVVADARHCRKFGLGRGARRIFQVMGNDLDPMQQQQLQQPKGRIPAAGPKQIRARAVCNGEVCIHRRDFPRIPAQPHRFGTLPDKLRNRVRS